MKKSSADYGVQIFGICRILFREESVQAKLDKYEVAIDLNREIEKKVMLESEFTRM